MPEPTPDTAMRREGEVRAEVLPGAEPLSAEGGPIGALVLHGFTGTPQSMRGLAEAFVDAGFSVEMPLLPGHGTSLDEMLDTAWDDWSSAAEAAFVDLAGRCERVVVAGLSMGGTLTLWLASRHDDIAGIVLINPACPPPGSSAETLAGLEAFAEAGVEAFDAIGNDIADPDQTELAYEQTPVKPLISLLTEGEALAGRLGSIECPVLLLTSPQDHVVAPEHSEHIAASIGGPVERVALERSYHVATLDHDRELINERAVEFANRVTGS
ncbi:MAG: alpha/beta hydrolase [Acidimicrobiales bacterium]